MGVLIFFDALLYLYNGYYLEISVWLTRSFSTITLVSLVITNQTTSGYQTRAVPEVLPKEFEVRAEISRQDLSGYPPPFLGTSLSFSEQAGTLTSRSRC